MKNKNLILVLIILLAFILRFYKLDSIPALNADEAAIGYNAYSLIETGLDEHGNPWPIHFQSFNDYKPGGYFYLVLPFVRILGLNIWAVRIPSATLAVASVYLIYLLSTELFKDKKVGILSALFLAINPWHIHFSRGGWEVNVASFFMLLGFWAFYKAISTQIISQKYLLLSGISLVASMYTYHSVRLVIPLLGLATLAIYHKYLSKNYKQLILPVLVVFGALIPLLIDFLGSAGYARAAGVGLFADTGPISRINEQRGAYTDFSSLVPKIFHNKVVNYGLAFADNWLSHYHGEFLFISGDEIQRNKVPETGLMNYYSMFLIPLGLWLLIKNTNKEILFIISWLLIAPVAAALTFQSPHALRAQNMLIPLVIISAYAAAKVTKSRLGFYLLAIVVLWSFSRYQLMYWAHMAKEYPFSSQYGVKQLVEYVSEHETEYENIYVSDRYDQPYILFLFYTKYPPEKFQNKHNLTTPDQFGFSTVSEYDKYHFQTINYDELRPIAGKSLIIGTDEQIPNEANIVKEIYGTNGYKYFKIVAN